MDFLCFIYSCRLTDLVGFGVAMATGLRFLENFPERIYKSMLIPIMQEDHKGGRFFVKILGANNWPLGSSQDLIQLLG